MEGVIAAIVSPPAASTLLTIAEESQIGAARRGAVALGHAHGVGPDAVARLAIVVTEAATNIVRHAVSGVVILRVIVVGEITAIEMLALDKGPGIADVHRAMQDGFSTAGTAGQGLGAMQRLSDVFEIYSQRDAGTAVLARVGDGLRAAIEGANGSAFEHRLGVVCLPIRGETACGDAWSIVANRHRVAAMLVDGLGHGPRAAEAAAIAVQAFPRLSVRSPEEALADLDAALRGSRGAALSLTVIDEQERTTRFSGVGNVDGRVLGGEHTAHLVPQNGIVGHTMPNLRSTVAPWPVGARLVMHSDGVSARWHLDAYPRLAAAHPSLIAGVIYRDFARGKDDATVLVLGDSRPERT